LTEYQYSKAIAEQKKHLQAYSEAFLCL